MVNEVQNYHNNKAEILKQARNRKLYLKDIDFYGMRKLFLELIDWKGNIPNNFYLSHGVPLVHNLKPPNASVLGLKYPIIFFNSELNRKKHISLDQLKSKETYTIGTPFVQYRNKYKINKSVAANGTLFFPAHSTHHISVEQNYNNICVQLAQLPERFKPIKICMYWLDFIRGHDKVFTESGFKVVCIGHMSNQNFYHDFYSLLKEFKYTSSNSFGSYCAYSVEMGIPFFMISSEVNYKMKENVKSGFNYGDNLKRELFNLFEVDLMESDVPTKEQIDFINEIIGPKVIDSEKIKNLITRYSFDSRKFKIKESFQKTIWKWGDFLPQKMKSGLNKIVPRPFLPTMEF